MNRNENLHIRMLKVALSYCVSMIITFCNVGWRQYLSPLILSPHQGICHEHCPPSPKNLPQEFAIASKQRSAYPSQSIYANLDLKIQTSLDFDLFFVLLYPFLLSYLLYYSYSISVFFPADIYLHLYFKFTKVAHTQELISIL